MEQDETHIYRVILNLKHILHFSLNTTLTPKTAPDPTGPKIGHSRTKNPTVSHPPPDKKCCFVIRKSK
jgi:hypothetical protein